VRTFQCYSTEGKVVVVLTWCASLFSAVFFPFKVWSAYKYRRGKLEAKGVRPTLKHLIFFRTALARAVSLQPLIGSPGGGDFESKVQSASGEAAAAEAAHSAILLQTSQLDAVLRVNADLQQKQLEQERKFKEQEQRMKKQEQRNKEQEQRMMDQEQRMKEQERAIAALQQSASPPIPSAHRDDA
jgi:flagellar biosynthesis GTPase FlhF